MQPYACVLANCGLTFFTMAAWKNHTRYSHGSVLLDRTTAMNPERNMGGGDQDCIPRVMDCPFKGVNCYIWSDSIQDDMENHFDGIRRSVERFLGPPHLRDLKTRGNDSLMAFRLFEQLY